jgi:hypothetical protein
MSADAFNSFVVLLGAEQQEVQFSIGRRTPQLARSCRLTSGSGRSIVQMRRTARKAALHAPFASMSQSLPQSRGGSGSGARLCGAAALCDLGPAFRLPSPAAGLLE